MIDPKVTVAELYRSYPQTHPVLSKYKIDLCCGGRHSLEVVAEKHGLDLKKLLEELNQTLEVRT